MIGQIKNIRFTYQFTSATVILSETSGGRFVARRKPVAAMRRSFVFANTETRP
jgi:hypothetical protein